MIEFKKSINPNTFDPKLTLYIDGKYVGSEMDLTIIEDFYYCLPRNIDISTELSGVIVEELITKDVPERDYYIEHKDVIKSELILYFKKYILPNLHGVLPLKDDES